VNRIGDPRYEQPVSPVTRGTTDQSRMDIEHRARLEALRKARDAYRAGPVISLDDMVKAAAVVPALVEHWQLFAKVLGAANQLVGDERAEPARWLPDDRCDECGQVEPRHPKWCHAGKAADDLK